MTGKVAFFATLQSPRRLLMLAIFTILASQSQAQAQNGKGSDKKRKIPLKMGSGHLILHR